MVKSETSSSQKIRVRLAPSPTGALHVGTARTALFNWLFARRNQGVFILRIEDTDSSRSQKEFEADIIDGLSWLGLSWDEGPDVEGNFGPYHQSARGSIYAKYIEQLFEKNLAYFCYCTEDELKAQYDEQITRGVTPKYSGRCRELLKEDRIKFQKEGRPSVIRFVMPERKLSFHDIIRGRVELNLGLMGDIIIAKDATHPLYNFAAVVDDAEMQITHVIRGEDHLANTPKQIAIFEALGLEIPHYAHLPLILGSDRSKLSKRHGAMSLNEYQTQGYLPEAMVNFLALLGWNPDTNEEIFSKDDLIEKFSLEKVQKAGAVFNLKKLVWLNSVYLRRLSGEVILEKVAPFWKKLHINFLSFKPEILIKILELQKERAKTLNELAESCRFFFEILEYDASLLIWKNISPLDTKANLEALIKLLSEIREEAFNKINLEQASADLRDKRGNGEIYWPWRVALSGLAGSPGPLDISEILGKTETLRRLQYAISKL